MEEEKANYSKKKSSYIEERKENYSNPPNMPKIDKRKSPEFKEPRYRENSRKRYKNNNKVWRRCTYEFIKGERKGERCDNVYTNAAKSKLCNSCCNLACRKKNFLKHTKLCQECI